MSALGFYVLVPECQIEAGVFNRYLTYASIQETVEQRVSEYDESKDEWFQNWFLPTLENINIRVLSWEELVRTISKKDSLSGMAIHEFYKSCLKFNGKDRVRK